MMKGYSIVEQTEGKGEEAEVVLIKQVKRGASTDKAGKVSGFFPLLAGFYEKNDDGKMVRAQLPCLKVILSNGDDDHHFEVRWSNYYGQSGLNPGKFKLVYVATKRPLFFYEHDISNNRKLVDKRTGNPIIDFVKMATEYGSEPIMSEGRWPKVIGWNFGDKQAFVKETDDMWECETFDETERKLTERFGKELANEILMLFVEHEVFNKWINEEVESVAA
jgi:hypothetical protein